MPLPHVLRAAKAFGSMNCVALSKMTAGAASIAVAKREKQVMNCIAAHVIASSMILWYVGDTDDKARNSH